jgi:hypothetical protein
VTRKPKQKAAKTTTGQLQSPTARLKLKAQTRPYFVKVADSAWLGYRKPLSGPGSWVVRAKGWEKTLWSADDNGNAADGVTVLSFGQARTEVQKLTGRKPGADTTTDDGAVITVDEALTSYEPVLRRLGKRVYNAKLPRYHLTDALLSKPVTLLTENELENWRDSLLEKGLAKSSVNRVINPLRAALTNADKTRVHIWRAGLKALGGAVKANNVVIDEDAKAQQWVAESYLFSHQIGLLTHTVAETGARPSQAVRLLIRDLNTLVPTAPRHAEVGQGRHQRPSGTQERTLSRLDLTGACGAVEGGGKGPTEPCASAVVQGR